MTKMQIKLEKFKKALAALEAIYLKPQQQDQKMRSPCSQMLNT